MSARYRLALASVALAVSCNLVVGLPDDPTFGAPPRDAASGAGGEAGDGGRATLPTGGRAGGVAGGAGGFAGNGGDANHGGEAGDESGGAGARPLEIALLPEVSSITAVTAIARTGEQPSALFDAFWVGADHAVRHYSAVRGQTPVITELGGITTRAPVALARKPGVIDVFIVDPSGRVLWKHHELGEWSPSGSAWETLGGAAERGVSASGDDSRMDLIAVDASGHVQHLPWQGAGWSIIWHDLPGVLADGKPASVATGVDRFQVFVRSDGVFRAKVFTDGAFEEPDSNGWYVWSDMYCTFSGLVADPVAVAMVPGRADAFLVGANLTQHKGSHGSADCASLGPHNVTELVVTARGGGLVDLFAIGGDELRVISGSSAGWGSWATLPIRFDDLAAVSPSAGSLFLIGRTSGGSRIGYVEWSRADDWTAGGLY